MKAYKGNMKQYKGSSHKQSQIDLATDLSDAEIESLIFMYQEEKMAMDVYDYFSELYDAEIFDKISDSESNHMSAVEKILVSNDIDISEYQELTSGEFINEELQSAYNDLIEQGSTSLSDALEVGIAIEEIDIEDLAIYLDDENLNSVLSNVYMKLEDASQNHLDAFTSASQNECFIA
jgi:hypothetical protein